MDFTEYEQTYNQMKADLAEIEKSDLKALASYLESNFPEVLEAKWSTAQKSDLPDSAYLLVKKSDSGDGKIRALPIRNSSGAIDKAHLRNALARVNQVKGFSPEAIAGARRKLEALGKRYLGKSDSKSESAVGFDNDSFKLFTNALEERIVILENKISDLTSINQALTESNEEMVRTEKAMLAESIVSTMLDLGEVETEERVTYLESLMVRTKESLKDSCDDVRRRKEKAPVLVERIQDPTVTTPEIEETVSATTFNVEEIFDKARKGDPEANRQIDIMIAKSQQAAKQPTTHKED